MFFRLACFSGNSWLENCLSWVALKFHLRAEFVSLCLGLNSGETMVSIVEGQRPEIPSFCPPMFADLIRRCWNPQRELRPTFKEITRMLKTMLGGPPIPANKGIPAMNHQEMNSTVPTIDRKSVV